MYKTVVIRYSPKAEEMARAFEETANRMENEGFELLSCAITPAASGILIFRRDGESTISGVTAREPEGRPIGADLG